jgi:Ankyrin repeats (3 copies)
VNQPHLLKILLAASESSDLVNEQDNLGRTPLMYACAYNQLESVIILFQKGANWHITDESGYHFIHHAIRNKHPELIAEIIDYVQIHGTLSERQWIIRKYLWTVLEHRRSCLDIRTHLELGTKLVWAFEDELYSPLHLATLHLHLDLLLQYKCPGINSKNSLGHTPLMNAYAYDSYHTCQMMLQSGAVLNESDKTGMTALGWGLRNMLSQPGPHESRNTVAEAATIISICAYLLNAGEDQLNVDYCQCPCSERGCSAVQFLLETVESKFKREHNIRMIPWMVEWILLVRQIKADDALQLLKSFYRLVRFDELGLVHTCCRVTANKQEYNPGRFWDSKGIMNLSNSIEFSTEDHVQIICEQAELIEKLENDCTSFCKGANETSYGEVYAFVTLLARRAVFVEEGQCLALDEREWRGCHFMREVS